MSTMETVFSYDVKDINNTMRQTGALLRAVNNIRLTYRDITTLGDKPSFARLFWLIVQISRTYTSLRRIIRMVQIEMATGSAKAGILSGIIPIGGPPVIDVPELDLSGLSVSIRAFRENLPMPLKGIDLSELPEDSRIMLQAVFEEDAQQTVEDARRILDDSMANYVSPWIVRPTTGFLRDGIRWQPEVSGTKIIADAPYAWWVEEGQRTFPGYHYMQGATELAKIRLPEKIRLELNGLLFNEIP